MQRITDKWASWLVPVALLIAVIAWFITRDIVRSVTVLVAFCPCALVLATPTAIMAAIGQATKHGVIIKSGEALEKMGKVDTIAFDKTGTLTYGKLEVCDIGIIANEKIKNVLEQFQMQGKASVLVAENKKCIGVIARTMILDRETQQLSWKEF